MAGPINNKIPNRTIHNIYTEAEVVTTEGYIISGAKAVSVKNVGDAVAIFDGIEIGSGEVFNYPFLGITYGKILFDATASPLKIFVFR